MNKLMKKTVFILLFVLFLGSFFVSPVKAEVTQEDLNAQIDTLKQTLIALLMQYVQELQTQLANLQSSQLAQAIQVQAIQEQVSVIPTPTPTPIPTPETIFTFDVSIGGDHNKLIKIPNAYYLSIMDSFPGYTVGYEISNKNGNGYKCSGIGFGDNQIGTGKGGGFHLKFPEKKVYEFSITCTDYITGQSETYTLSVDTR
jgi:hypothetical protein